MLTIHEEVTSDSRKVQHAFFTLATPSAFSDDTIFQDIFTLREDVVNFEVRVFVGEKDNLRVNSCTIEKID